MPRYEKKTFPVANVRRFLEPGPIVLVSSHWNGADNIMTMGWHMVMGFSPSLIGCYIWDRNHSFDMIRKSRACVVNIPETAIGAKVVAIGNCSGRSVDKFAALNLTAEAAAKVPAPLIGECFANFECRLADDGLIARHGLFVFEVVKAHVATSPRLPRTLHYRGDGEFMISGGTTSLYRARFKPQNL